MPVPDEQPWRLLAQLLDEHDDDIPGERAAVHDFIAIHRQREDPDG